jgi:prepilin-type N-terminal cleavage/methylation domain-containing protein
VLANIRKDQTGFTLTELSISITIIGMLTVSLLGALTYYYTNIMRNNIAADMNLDSQNLIRSTAEEIRYGSGVRQTNTISDPNSPAGGWNTSNANFVIVIAKPATDTSNNYIIDSLTGAPYTNEIVYYKQGSDLFRRNLAHPLATGNSFKTSCPPQSATASCPADARLIQYVDDMIFTLYDQDDAATTNPTLARSVKIQLRMERDTFGSPIKLENTVQVTLRNRFS